MNAYKKKLKNTTSNTENCVVDLPQLHDWYADAMDNREARDRIAVSGFNISRGAFGTLPNCLLATQTGFEPTTVRNPANE